MLADTRAFRAIAEALVGAEVAPEIGREIGPLVVGLSTSDKQLLRVLLAAVEHALPRARGNLHRFSSLAPAERSRILAALAESHIPALRQAFSSLKSLAMLAHYGSLEAGAAIGYDGPWLGRVPVDVVPRPDIADGIIDGADAEADIRLRVQACVIGTGAGGAAALAELAALGVDAVAVEAGPYTTAGDFTQRELEMLPLLYQQSGLRATANKAIAILQGRGIGGSTLHNTGLVYSPPGGIIARWQEEHGVDIDNEELSHRVAAVRSALGALAITPDRINHNNDALRRGADVLGWRYRIADHNRVSCSACGYCMLGCAYNRKNNALLTLIPHALTNGARVLANARAVRIEGRNRARRVRCVLFDSHGRPTGRSAIISSDVVIVAAGALDTPALLRRSGLGNSNVGVGLRLHPAPLVSAVMPEPVTAWRGLPQSVVVEEFASFMNSGHGGFLLIPNAANWPGMIATVLPGIGKAHRTRMFDYPRLASAAVLLHDETQGRVTATRAGTPRAHYWPTARDLLEIRRGVLELGRLYFAAGAERLYLPYADAPAVSNEAELANVLSHVRAERHRISLSSVHPQGSCPMGADARTSVCKPSGELWGENGVFVADTSLFPTSVGVPPQVTTMVFGGLVGARAAEYLIRRAVRHPGRL